MVATYVPGSDSIASDGHLYQFIPFLATCPGCRQQRPQLGYHLAALRKLLDRGFPVEAYCERCEEFWAISVGQRARLATWVG